MTQATATAAATHGATASPFVRSLRSTEIDTRLLGMIAALAMIWIGFNFASGGRSSRRATSGTCRSRARRSRSWRPAWS